MTLEDLDRSILRILEGDGRKPFSEIAKALNISNTQVHQRIAKLKKVGILKGAGILLDEKKLGFEWSAFTGIVLKEDSDSGQIIEALKKIPEVTECYFITGQFTLYIRIHAKNADHMRRVLYDKIDHIAGVLKTESMIDFGAAFKRNVSVDL